MTSSFSSLVRGLAWIIFDLFRNYLIELISQTVLKQVGKTELYVAGGKGAGENWSLVVWGKLHPLTRAPPQVFDSARLSNVMFRLGSTLRLTGFRLSLFFKIKKFPVRASVMS